MEPKSEASPETEVISPRTNSTTELDKYVAFLAARARCQQRIALSGIRTRIPDLKMSAIFDASDPASPSAYDASHTALLLTDFQQFIINHCGRTGQTATATAAMMRDWALKNGIMIMHSIIDVHAQPPETYKGVARIKMMMDELAKDGTLAAEPPELAVNQGDDGLGPNISVRKQIRDTCIIHSHCYLSQSCPRPLPSQSPVCIIIERSYLPTSCLIYYLVSSSLTLLSL